MGLTVVIKNQEKECAFKEDVKQAHLQGNQDHFNQAHDTLLFHEPVFSLIAPLSKSAGVKSILQGDDAVLNELDPMIQKVF